MNKKVLIVAHSGCMLALKAKQIGLLPLVIDCFADQDTREYACDSIKVDALDVVSVTSAFKCLDDQHQITGLIYGSGLEQNQETLEYLQRQLLVYGNSFLVFSAIVNKRCFFAKLNSLGIAYPETVFELPEGADNWLLKPKSGEGGFGIQKYRPDISELDCYYWQKFIPGIPKSVLFVAHEQGFEVIGFHQQLISRFNEHDFIFSGLISIKKVDVWIKLIVKQWIAKIVCEFSLKGVNSLDFIVKGRQGYLLEVNPRPSASMHLYSASVLQQHMASITEDTVEINSNQEVINIYQGYLIVYAKSKITISDDLEWPIWCHDIPQTGSIINTGMPICSIIAREKNEQQIHDLLLLRQGIILEMFIKHLNQL